MENAVRQILEDVRNEGDAALRRYALKFDRTDYNEVLSVYRTKKESKPPYVAPSMRDIIDSAAKIFGNIMKSKKEFLVYHG